LFAVSFDGLLDRFFDPTHGGPPGSDLLDLDSSTLTSNMTNHPCRNMHHYKRIADKSRVSSASKIVLTMLTTATYNIAVANV
jgi:hypothetical protein